MITATDLESVEIFSEFQPAQLAEFAAKAADLRVERDDWIVHEGDLSHFYVLLSGEVQVSKELNGLEVEIGRQGSGHSFGEVAIVVGATANLSYCATCQCRLARFDRQHFQ